MVWVKLNVFEFEAEKFETRTMPTPDMKGKEVIYWIRIVTPDKRRATDLQRFMDGAPKYIDLRVPSVLVAARTEVESFHQISPTGLPVAGREAEEGGDKENTGSVLSEKEAGTTDVETGGQWRFEIILRRTIPSSSERQTQSPYG